MVEKGALRAHPTTQILKKEKNKNCQASLSELQKTAKGLQ